MDKIQEYTNRELFLTIKSFEEKVDNCFRGVHERQDRTNGFVKKNSEFREKYDEPLKEIICERNLVRQKVITNFIDLLFKFAVVIGGIIFSINYFQ